MSTQLETAINLVKADSQLSNKQLTGPSPTGALSHYIANSQQANIPDDILELGKRHIVDTIASLIVSAKLKPAKLAQGFASIHGRGAEQATILTTNKKTTLLDAIFANAMTAHAAEINDFCPSAFVQPGPPILSTLLAIGETQQSDGNSILKALITGYEIACRFPKALGIKNLRKGGLSNHGFAPVFGAAAAASSLLGLKENQIPDVLAYCVQQASGSYNWMRDEEHIEKAFVFAGMPARNGASAALLVHHGFTGTADPLQGSPGWLESTLFIGPESDMDRNKLIDGLGENFEMPLVAYKRFPVGGPTQPTVEAMLALTKQVDSKDVAHIEVKMPGHPAIFANAKMPALNIPYLCAVILEDGKLEFNTAQSHERFMSPSVRELMAKVDVLHDPSMETEPRTEPASVAITLANGETVSHRVEHVLGFPTRPMSHDDVDSKARELINPILGATKTNELLDVLWNIENIQNINELIPLLIVTE